MEKLTAAQTQHIKRKCPTTVYASN